MEIWHDQKTGNGGGIPTTNLDLDMTLIHGMTIRGAGTGIFNINGNIVDGTNARTITKNGTHTVRFNGDITIGKFQQGPGTSQGGTVILNGIVTLDGSNPQFLINRGTLRGTGTINTSGTGNFVADFASTSTVAPGDAPGDIGTLTFNRTGTGGEVSFRNDAVWDIDLGPNGQSDLLAINTKMFTGTNAGVRLVVADPTAVDGSDYTIATIANGYRGGAAAGTNPIAGIFRADSVIPTDYGVRVNPDSIQLVSTPASLLVFDDFDSLAGSIGDDVSDPTDIPWTSLNSALSTGTSAYSSPKAMKNGGTLTYRAMTGALPETVALAPAEGLTLDVMFRTNNAGAIPANSTDGYRIGLFGPDDTGYFVNIGAGSGGADLSWLKDENGTDAMGGPAAANTALAAMASADAPVIDDNAYHRFVLNLVNVGGGMELAVDFFDDPAGDPITLTATDFTLPITEFDRIFLGTGSHSVDFWIDDVMLTSSVPEPSTLLLLLVGLAGLYLRRRV